MEGTTTHRDDLKRQTSASRLKGYLNERVIGQEQMIEAVVDMVHHARVRKGAIDAGMSPLDIADQKALLIIASTGEGKTYTLENLARTVDADLTFIDASSLTGRGWRGMSVDEALLPVAENQKAHPGRMQIVVWDEADKLGHFSKGANGDLSFNPAKDLLKFLDGGRVSLYCDQSVGERSVVDLDAGALFHVFAGAFTGIEDIVAKRLNLQAKPGFNATLPTEEELLALRLCVCADDVEQFGLPRELVGRIGRIVSMLPLSEDSMRAILSGGDHSIEAKYRRMLDRVGLGFSISDDARDVIARQAVESGLGARFLSTSLVGVAARAIADADESSATQIRVVTLGDGEISYALEDYDDEKEEGWTLGSGADDERAEASVDDDLQESERRALEKSIDCSVAQADVWHDFRYSDQFYRLARLLLMPSSTLPYPEGADDAVGVLAPIMRLMYDRYGEDQQTLGYVYEIIDGFEDSHNAYFGAIAEMAIEAAEKASDSERVAWYSGILEEFEEFREKEPREQERAIANARHALRVLAYDKARARQARRVIEHVRASA